MRWSRAGRDCSVSPCDTLTRSATRPIISTIFRMMKIPKDVLDLASHIVKTKEGHFDPSKFEDQYEDALKDLLKKKQEGKPIDRPERPRPTNVVNLMEALRRSVETSGAAAQSKRKARESAPRGAHEKEQSKRKKARR